MPKLWDDTIEAHRRTVREATLDAAAELIAEGGLRAVTMSQIAQRTGIGRATLYKYFPDVESLLSAWHERQVNAHVEQLAATAAKHDAVEARLRTVLETYAAMQRHGHAGHLPALLHSGEHVQRAHDRLSELVAGLISEGVQAGVVRTDVAPRELAAYCLHALGAAGGASSHAALRRLVDVTLAGMRSS